MKIRSASAKGLEWLSGFYSAAGYGGQVKGDDEVFFATENNRIIGVVRLANEKGYLVLRGMQVAEGCRGKGVGSALLVQMKNAMNRQPCYCLPYIHLEAFYSAAGFAIAHDEDLPGFLHERKRHYLERQMKVISMLRHPAGPVL